MCPNSVTDNNAGVVEKSPKKIPAENLICVCLQHFLFAINTLSIDGMIFQTDSNHSVNIEDNRIFGHFPENPEGETLSFDGIVNAFPVGTFTRHTDVSYVSLQGEMDGEIAIQVRHVDKSGDRVLYEEPFSNRKGHWESPGIPLGNQEGRYYLSCRVRGIFSVRHLGWWTTRDLSTGPSFLVCFTRYQGKEFFKEMIRDFCAYTPLKKLNISVLVVDNSETLRRDQLPDDHRISLVSQPNLGGTGGVMRGLSKARDSETDYLVTIADDDMILHPEIIYRLVTLQSLVNQPLAIGAMMLYLDRPTTLHEQGAVVPQKPFAAMHALGKGADLVLNSSIEILYRERHCDYTAWWLMSSPALNLPFIPAFFIYFGDITHGLLLRQDRIRTIVPPYLFIWQTFGFDSKSYKLYDSIRNELAMRLVSELAIHRLSTILWFSRKIRRSLANYDYNRALLLLRSFEDVLHPSSWALDPLAGSNRIQEIRNSDPLVLDFSSTLSTVYAPVKTRRRSRLVSISQRLFSFLTMAGYLNPFPKSVAADGGFVFRYQEDNDVWQWAGYRQVAAIDSNKRGVLCERSWRRMTEILLRTIRISIRWLWSAERLRKEYQRPSSEYEKMWSETFEKIDRNKTQAKQPLVATTMNPPDGS
ncbi:MAG: glycosyltransferase family 2 protein [Leptospirales bacterium]